MWYLAAVIADDPEDIGIELGRTVKARADSLIEIQSTERRIRPIEVST